MMSLSIYQVAVIIWNIFKNQEIIIIFLQKSCTVFIHSLIYATKVINILCAPEDILYSVAIAVNLTFLKA